MLQAVLGCILLADWIPGSSGSGGFNCPGGLLSVNINGPTHPGGPIARACCTDHADNGVYKGRCSASACQVFGFKNSAHSNCVAGSTSGRCAYCTCDAVVEDCPDTESSNSLIHCWGTTGTSTTAPSGVKCGLAGELCLYDGNSANFKICKDVQAPQCPEYGCPAYTEYDYDTNNCKCLQLVQLTTAATETWVKVADVTQWSTDHLTALQVTNAYVVTEYHPGTGGLLPADFNGGYYELQMYNGTGSCDTGVCICLECPPNSIWFPPGTNLSMFPWIAENFPNRYPEVVPPEHGICICDASSPIAEQRYLDVNTTAEPLVCRKQEQGCGNPDLQPCVSIAPGFIPIYKNFRRRSHVMIGKVLVDQVPSGEGEISVQVTFTLFPPDAFDDVEDMEYRRGLSHGPVNKPTHKKYWMEDWVLSFRKIEFWISTSKRRTNGWGKPQYLKKFSRPTSAGSIVQFYVWEQNITLPYSCHDSMSGALWLTARVQAYGGKNGHGSQWGYTDVLFTGRDHHKHDTSIPITCQLGECPGFCTMDCGDKMECKYDTLGTPYCGCRDGYFPDANVTDNSSLICTEVPYCDVSTNEGCPFFSVCNAAQSNYSCTCIPDYVYSPSLSACVRPHPVAGCTKITPIANDGTRGTQVGTAKVFVTIPTYDNATLSQIAGVPSFYVEVQMDGANTLEHIDYDLTSKRRKDHVPGSFSWHFNCDALSQCDGKTYTSAARTVIDWTTGEPFNLDCSDLTTSVWLTLRIRYKTSTGSTMYAWAYGGGNTKDSDDFEVQITCLEPVDPIAETNCTVCTAPGSNPAMVLPLDDADEGKYQVTCQCASGYNETDCFLDNNECAAPILQTCGTSDAICTNSPGSYTCSCKKPFSYQAGACVRAATTDGQTVDSSAASAASETGSWAWIVIGVMGALLVVAISLNVMQFILAKRHAETPYFMTESIGDFDASCPVPPPSTNTGYASPSALRHRGTSKTSTPKADEGNPLISG